MKKLEPWFLLSSLLALAPSPMAWAIRSQSADGSVVMTKSLWGAPGNAHISGNAVNVGFAFGEQASGYQIVGGAGAVATIGYYGGRSSSSGDTVPLKVSRVLAESVGPIVDTIQTGALLQGRVEIDLVDPIQGANLLPNINLSLVQDHLGQVQNSIVPYYITFDPTVNRVFLNSVTGWLANSLYDVTIANALQSSDGYTTPFTLHYRYLTLFGPSQENVLYTPIDAPAAAASAGQNPADPPKQTLRVVMAPGASKDYSYLLSNDNPVVQPLQVNPQAIADANRKIAADNGAYAVPVALQELVVYNSQVQSVPSLSVPAQISWSYKDQNGFLPGLPTAVRSSTLALYSLDTLHHLWVRLPASAEDDTSKTVNVSVSQLTVFALIGSGDATTSFTSVFPVPWRPHGPNAGLGAGQTGTEAGGITFENLPPECTITIYTLSANRVQEIRHSDTSAPIAGEETWLGLTSGGQHAASGVYLWEVQSPIDKKTGKLIIIR